MNYAEAYAGNTVSARDARQVRLMVTQRGAQTGMSDRSMVRLTCSEREQCWGPRQLYTWNLHPAVPVLPRMPKLEPVPTATHRAPRVKPSYKKTYHPRARHIDSIYSIKRKQLTGKRAFVVSKVLLHILVS